MADRTSLLDRRELLALGCAGLFARAVPADTAVAVTTAAPIQPAIAVAPGKAYRLARSGIVVRLRSVREEYAAAIEAYRSTGDGEPIAMARLHAKHRFGFALGLEARGDDERALFREAGALLEQMEGEFPELPLDPAMKRRFATLRHWAEAGGQYPLLREKAKARLHAGGSRS